MSYRAKLNEYCQKNGLVPLYEYNQIGSMWLCTLTLTVQGTDEEDAVYKSRFCTSKADAAEEVAVQVFETATSQPLPPADTNQLAVYKRIVMIDLENVPCLNKEYDNGTLYLGFISTTHRSVTKYKDWKIISGKSLLQETLLGNKLLCKVDGGVKEGVDHFMSAYTSYILEYVALFGLQTTIVIVSCDNSSWCTRSCLQVQARWKNVKIHIENTTSI